MIIEMRTYILKPTTLKRFLDIYNNEIRETHISILGNQIGFFILNLVNLIKWFTYMAIVVMKIGTKEELFWQKIKILLVI